MGVKIPKEIFLKIAEHKNVYCLLPGPNIVEHILSPNQYNSFLNSKNGEKTINNIHKNNLPLSTIASSIKFFSIKPTDMHTKYLDYGGSDNFFKKIKKNFEKAENSKALSSIYESAFNDKFYIISEQIDINVQFAKTQEEFVNFFKEKDYYRFNEKKGIIETVRTKPELTIKEIQYLYTETRIDVGFELTICGARYNENDLYYYNDKHFIKSLFERKEDLITFNIKRLERQLKYFNELKGDNQEGMVITNAHFQL